MSTHRNEAPNSTDHIRLPHRSPGIALRTPPLPTIDNWSYKRRGDPVVGPAGDGDNGDCGGDWHTRGSDAAKVPRRVWLLSLSASRSSPSGGVVPVLIPIGSSVYLALYVPY